MLELRDLNAFYGDSHILQSISLSVSNGERVALVGRNGVGKSTLMKSVMNAGPRVTGEVLWDGTALAKTPAHRRAHLGLAFVPEDRRILPGITVLENLLMAARGVARSRKVGDAAQALQEFPMLIPLERRPADRLSGGQQQMLAVARAIVAAPRMLLLDEPTEGLAPVIVEELAIAVREACERAGTALLLCEQNLWFARRCTDRLYVMDSGRIVFAGTWADFDRDTQIRDRYLAI